MWHEARKQEKKIRGMIVDYRKRADRRKEFYERIRADPTQFLQLHGRKTKINFENSDLTDDSHMMKWQGQGDNLIDRFDVRAHLDYIPPARQSKDDSEPELTSEERQTNYERFRILAQNEFLGVTEENFMKQLQLEEQFGVNAHQIESDKSKKKNSQSTAAIGYNYDTKDDLATTVPFSQTILNIETSTTSNRFEEFAKDFSDESDVDMDVAIDINKIGTTEAHELNNCGKRYGMVTNDFFSYLTKDEDEKQSMKAIKEQEADKILGGGRKTRRERRSQREKRILGKPMSPPSYAAKEEKPKSFNEEEEDDDKSSNNSRSPSAEKITFITSFGGEDELKPHPKISISLNKPAVRLPGTSKSYAEKVKQNLDKLKWINDNERDRPDFRRRSRSLDRRRKDSRSLSRRRHSSRSRSSSRRRNYSSRSSRSTSRSRRNYSSRSRSDSRRRTRSSRSYSGSSYSSRSRGHSRRRSVDRKHSYKVKSLSQKRTVSRKRSTSRKRSYSRDASASRRRQSPTRHRSNNARKSNSRRQSIVKRSISKKKSSSSSSSSSSVSSSTTSEDSQPSRQLHKRSKSPVIAAVKRISPLPKAKSPVQEKKLSVRDIKSPARDNKSPIRDKKSLVRQSKSPSKQVKSPVRQRSPPRSTKSPPKRPKPPAKAKRSRSPVASSSDLAPIKRYYGRRKDNESSSSLSVDSQSDDADRKTGSNQSSANDASKVKSFNRSSDYKVGLSKSTVGGPTINNPRDRLKKKMQLLLNKQYKADKKAETERIERQQQQQQERDEEMRELALKLRKKQRELRHRYGDNLDSKSESESDANGDSTRKKHRSSSSSSTSSSSSSSNSRDKSKRRKKSSPNITHSPVRYRRSRSRSAGRNFTRRYSRSRSRDYRR